MTGCPYIYVHFDAVLYKPQCKITKKIPNYVKSAHVLTFHTCADIQ